MTGPLMLTYGISPALGAFVATLGALIYSQAKASTIWKVSLVIFMVFAVAMVSMQVWYFPLFFGIGGAFILISYLGVLWFWANERKSLQGLQSAAADYRLVGYTFMLMATWFTCGIGSQPFLDALEGQDPMNPIAIMIFLALGWIFLF